MRHVLLWLCAILLTISQATFPANSKMPVLTPQDQEVLESLEKDINNFVNTLSPDEQKQFWQDVEKLSDEMSKMSPDELDSFIEKAFTQGMMGEAPESAPTASEAPVIPVKTEPIAPVVKPNQLDEEIKALVEKIDAVTEALQAFLKKTQIIPDMSGKVDSWATAKTLTPWKEGINWNKAKKLIEDLIQKLHKLKERDTNTKQYKYMSTLIANKPLANSIVQLENTISPLISLIELPALPDTSLSKSSARAIERILSAVGQILFVTNFLDEVEKVFEQYNTTAEQIKKEMQSIEDRARKSSKGTARSSAANYTPRNTTPGSTNHEAYDDGYSRYNNSPDYDYPTRTAHSDGTENEKSFKEKGGGKPSARGGTGLQKGKPGAAPAIKPADSDTTTSPKKDAKEAAAKSSQDDTIADSYLDEATSQLQSAVDILGTYGSMITDLKGYLTGKNPVNIDFALTGLPDTIKHLQKGIDKLKALEQRLTRLKAKELKEKYASNIKKTFKKINEKLDATKTAIEEIKTDWNIHNRNIFADKQYAYFGLRADEADPKVVQLISKPTSLYELSRAIESLQKVVEELSKVKK